MKIPPPGILRGKDSTTAGGDKWPGPQLLFTPNELLNILAWFTPSQSFLGEGGGAKPGICKGEGALNRGYERGRWR